VHRAARARGQGVNLQWARTRVVRYASTPARRHESRGTQVRRRAWHRGASAHLPPPTWPESHHAKRHVTRQGDGRSPVGNAAPEWQRNTADNAAASRAAVTRLAPGCHGRCVAAAGRRVCSAAPPRAAPPWRRAAPPLPLGTPPIHTRGTVRGVGAPTPRTVPRVRWRAARPPPGGGVPRSLRRAAAAQNGGHTGAVRQTREADSTRLD